MWARRLNKKNRLQGCLAGSFDLRPACPGQGDKSRAAGGRKLALPRGLSRSLAFLDSRPAGSLRSADSGNSGGAYLLPLWRYGCSGSYVWRPKQLAEFLLKGINSLFNICCPTQLLRRKICE
jgi:hypothetical protein